MRRNIFIVTITFLIVLLVAFLSFNLHKKTEREVITQFNQHQMMLSKVMASGLENVLSLRSNGLKILSSFPSIQYLNKAQLGRDISAYFGHLKTKGVLSISLYDSTGEIIYSTNTIAVERNYNRCEYFIWGKKIENKGKIYLSSLHPQMQNEIDRAKIKRSSYQSYRFILVTPVYQEVKNDEYRNPNKKFVGMLSIAMSLDLVLQQIPPIMSDVSSKDSSTDEYVAAFHNLWVIDTTGTLLFHSENPELPMMNVHQHSEKCTTCHSSTDHVHRILRIKEGTTEYQLKDASEKLAAFTTMHFENVSWIVVINTPYDVVAAFIQREFYEMILMMCIIGSALIVSATLIHKNYRFRVRTEEEFKQLQEKQILQEQILQSETRYRIIIENAHDLIWILDAKGNFTFVNKRGEDVSGYKASDLIGKHFALFITPKEDLPRILDVVRKTMSGHVQSFEVNVRRVDGSVLTLLTNTTPIFESGKVVGAFSFGRDITERKKREEVLRESEERFRLLFENMLDGFAYCKMLFENNHPYDFIYLNVNSAFEKLTGLKNVVGKKVTEIISGIKESNPELFEIYGRVALSGQPERFEVYIRSLEMWLSISVYSSKKNYFIAVFDNITDRKRAEELLRESEEQFRNLAEQSPNMIFINQRGKIVYANELCEKMTGYTRDELLSPSFEFSRLIAPGSQAKIQESIRRHLQGEEVSPIEYSMIAENGTRLEAILATKLINFKEESAILGVVTDITERKRVEKEIAMLAHSIKSISECVSITDINNNILFVNESFRKTYGYEDHELLGKHINMVHSPNVSDEINRKIQLATLEGGWHGELLNRRKDGSEFPISLSTSVVSDEHGTALALISVATDITERKNAEQNLIAAKDRAEQSDRLKDSFIANMSHEIRTPLNIILGYTNIIADEYANRMNPGEKFFFQNIDSASQRLIRTVEHILNISRIEADSYALQKEDIVVCNRLENIVNDFRLLVQKKNLKLELTCECPPLIISIDNYSFDQALTNVIDNAIKFTKKGDVTINVTQEMDEVCITIRDTGIGISEEYLQHIFESFSQEVIGYTRPYEGLGLGLALTKKYVELNGGTISVESKKWEGTTFRLRFPLVGNVIPEKEIVTDKQETKIEKSHRKKRRTILVVEDEEQSQRFIQILFSSEYNIIAASDVLSTFNVLQQNVIDLILMDLSLHGEVDGIELTKRLRATEQFASIPIIAVTAHAFPTDRQNSLQAGCNDYLSKPFKSTHLRKLINKYIT